MKCLVIGSGGREHALVWALRRNARRKVDLFCAPGNAGIAELATCVPIGATDVTGAANFCAQEKIDLTIVGPEAALAAGTVDEFV
jgi:phosphoribosylamine--glycine ligase